VTADEICQELDRLKADGAPFERLLASAIAWLHESDERFDWTGVYELHRGDVLRLGPYVGEPTDHVFIGVGQGVCGAAIAAKSNMNVPDVSKVENYLACSTTTRSELVVLIRRGERIYAQIDIDSDQVGAFSDKIVGEVQRVADWLAEAYQLRELVRR
jgi:GAF domain-containing protein